MSWSFILWLKNQSGEPSKKDRRADTACCGSQTAGKDAQETFFLHTLLNPFGKKIAKAGQRNGRTRAREVDELLIHADRAEDNADDNIGNQDPRRCQLRLVDQDLSDPAKQTANQKSF